MNIYAAALGKLRDYVTSSGGVGSGSGVKAVRELIRSALVQCNSIKFKHKSYSKMLYKAKEKIGGDVEALKIEAFRSLLHFAPSGSSGDLLRMAGNSLYEDRRVSKRVFMSDFPIGNKDAFLKTTSSIFDFLMDSNSSSSDEAQFWGCMNKSEVMKKVLNFAFVSSSSVPTHTDSDDEDDEDENGHESSRLDSHLDSRS